MNLHTGCTLVASALVVATSASAQGAPIAPAPPTPAVQGDQSGVGNAAVESLMQSESISRSEAQKRIALQADILALLESSSLLNDPGFVDLAVQHQPVYQVWINFADNSNKSRLLQEVPPQLRQYVKIRKAKDDKGARSAGFNALSKAITATGSAYPIGYDAVDEQYFVDVPNESTRTLVANVIPAGLANRVRINVGVAPMPEQGASTTATPSGVRAGDWVAPGWRTTSTAGSAKPGAPCTLAYAVTFGTNLRGILTAGHCTEPKEVNYGDHKVTFNAAYIERTTGNYDVAIYRTDGLTTDYQLYYTNTYRIPEFPASGWLNTKNFIRGSNQWQGMSNCISGSVTGLACGKISSAAYDWRGTGSSSFVRLTNTAQGDLSQGGDSGAPVFAYVNPNTTRDISATGIHVAGSGSGNTAVSVYMPIDRIFDLGVSNLRLVTTPW